MLLWQFGKFGGRSVGWWLVSGEFIPARYHSPLAD
jgi:hypothetical protein